MLNTLETVAPYPVYAKRHKPIRTSHLSSSYQTFHELQISKQTKTLVDVSYCHENFRAQYLRVKFQNSIQLSLNTQTRVNQRQY